MKKIYNSLAVQIREKRAYQIFLGIFLLLLLFVLSRSLFSGADAQELMAPYNAKVSSIHVSAGQDVKKGEKLFVFEAYPLEKSAVNVEYSYSIDEQIRLQEEVVRTNRALENEAQAEYEHYTNEEAKYALARRTPNISDEDYKKNRSAELELQALKNNAKANYENISLDRVQNEKILAELRNSRGQQNSAPVVNKVEPTSNKTFEYLAPYDGKIEEVLVQEGDTVQTDIVILKVVPVL